MPWAQLFTFNQSSTIPRINYFCNICFNTSFPSWVEGTLSYASLKSRHTSYAKESYFKWPRTSALPFIKFRPKGIFVKKLSFNLLNIFTRSCCYVFFNSNSTFHYGISLYGVCRSQENCLYPPILHKQNVICALFILMTFSH